LGNWKHKLKAEGSKQETRRRWVTGHSVIREFEGQRSKKMAIQVLNDLVTNDAMTSDLLIIDHHRVGYGAIWNGD
jgi:hypothetical protein